MLATPTSWTWSRSRYLSLVLFSLALPFICMASRPLYGDIWWLLANGRVLVQNGGLPTADPFTFASHSAGYADAQWLAQLAYYASYQLLGLPGVSVLNALAGSLGFGILLHLAWQRSRQAAAACIVNIVGLLIAMPYLHPRAQTLAVVAFAATNWLLAARWPGLRRLVALGLVEAIWANVHGSFFLGPLLTVVYAAGEVADAALESRWRSLVRNRRLRFLAAALTAQLIGSLLNPYGVNLYVYALSLTSNPAIRNHITEWFPTSLSDWSQATFFISVALAGMALARARRWVSVADVLVVCVFAVLGLQAVRNLLWWTLAAPPVVAPFLADLRLPGWLARLCRACVPQRENARANLVRAGILGLVVLGALPWVRMANPLAPVEQRSLVDALYPLKAVEFLHSHALGSRIYEEQPWGAYLDWAVWPKYQPMVDSAIEVHPEQVWLDVLALNHGNAFWQELLDQYGVDVLLLSREDQASFIQAVERSPRWQRVYQDEQAVIYVPVPASRGTPSR